MLSAVLRLGKAPSLSRWVLCRPFSTLKSAFQLSLLMAYRRGFGSLAPMWQMSLASSVRDGRKTGVRNGIEAPIVDGGQDPSCMGRALSAHGDAAPRLPTPQPPCSINRRCHGASRTKKAAAVPAAEHCQNIRSTSGKESPCQVFPSQSF